MVPNDRLFCILVNPYDEGYIFKQWMHHITLIPWFRSDIPRKTLFTDIETAVKDFNPFEIYLSNDKMNFGHQPGKQATLVKLPSPVNAIEKTLRDYLHSNNAWLIDETTKLARIFMPHITAQASEDISKIRQFYCDSIYIVRQLGNTKLIDTKIELHK